MPNDAGQTFIWTTKIGIWENFAQFLVMLMSALTFQLEFHARNPFLAAQPTNKGKCGCTKRHPFLVFFFIFSAFYPASDSLLVPLLNEASLRTTHDIVCCWIGSFFVLFFKRRSGLSNSAEP